MQKNTQNSVKISDFEDHLDAIDTETEEISGSFTEITERTASAAQAGQRLDVFVAAEWADATRAEAQRLITLPEAAAEGIRVNGRRERASYKIRAGDSVTFSRPAPQAIALEPEAIPLIVLFEDEDMLVIDKARGMVVHPAPGSEHGTLVHAVLAHASDLSGIGGELRPGIVHRLDKDTGGLIMVAKTDFAHHALQAQIQSREAERRYLALVWGVPKFQHANIDAPIGRHPSDRKRMAVITDPRQMSRPAQTELFVQETFSETFALCEAKLHTGRTHQIRVHCAYIQHPIVGDPTYGGQRKIPAAPFSASRHSALETALTELRGQALHAYSLAFTHPRTGERLSFQVPLPSAMQSLLDLLRVGVGC